MRARSNVFTLVSYWMKGRFTRATGLWMLIGELFSIAGVLFVGGTFLNFSSKFSLGPEISLLSLNLIFALFLIGLIQSGFTGSGLPVSAADVDYVFTSPVSHREVFLSKILMNSLTTVVLSLPPILALYIRLADHYGTSFLAATLAGSTTLVFFLSCLFFSADITLSLNSRLGTRLRAVRNVVLIFVAGLSIVPMIILIPGTPDFLTQLIETLPSGLAATVSLGFVKGTPLRLETVLDVTLLGAWSFFLLGLGVRMSRQNFYEVLQIYDQGDAISQNMKIGTTVLDTTGRSVWSVVRKKERVLMGRTKELRSLLVSALFLSGFLVIYSLSGAFQSSPTSFLFLLFIIGSFGSGNASRWLEKERLWLIKSSTVDLKRYVREIYLARVTPLLLVLSPIAAGAGLPLLIGKLNDPGSLVLTVLTLFSALEIAALMMAGGMYFGTRYGQTSTEDPLAAQGQDLADVRRFLYQTVINLSLAAPLMGVVLAADSLLTHTRGTTVGLAGFVLGLAGLGYSMGMLWFVLNLGGKALERREDL